MHVTPLHLAQGIYLDKKAQVTSLLIEKVKIPDKYSDFSNVFSEEKTLVLPERTKLNKHPIDLKEGK